LVFPKNGFAKAKTIEKTQELVVDYAQEWVKEAPDGSETSRRMALKASARSGAGDEERCHPVPYIIGNHRYGAILGIEPGTLLGEPLRRAGNVEGRPSKRR
jgi:hypothetical protein